MKTKISKALPISCALALLLLLLVVQFVSASTEPTLPNIYSAFSPLESETELVSAVPLQQGIAVVNIQAASGATIPFPAQNGVVDLPHLILYQNNHLTSAISRELEINVENIQVNPGVTATIEITVSTQHGDPDLGGDPNLAPRIPVWFTIQTRTVPVTGTVQWFNIPFTHTFTETILYAGNVVTVPTDYFRVDVLVNGLPVPGYDLDYAFLMENQYEIDLEPDGKNDYKARIHYCDMFPFGKTDPASWIDRSLVHEHISNSLAPMIQTVFDTEVNTWGFGPLHDAWDVDNVLEIVVGDGGTFSHVPTTSPMVANPIPSFSALNSVTQKQEVVR